MPSPETTLPAKRKRRTIADATPLELSATLFVAALAEDADKNRGMIAENGTPDTRARVAGIVKERFFK